MPYHSVLQQLLLQYAHFRRYRPLYRRLYQTARCPQRYLEKPSCFKQFESPAATIGLKPPFFRTSTFFQHWKLSWLKSANFQPYLFSTGFRPEISDFRPHETWSNKHNKYNHNPCCFTFRRCILLGGRGGVIDILWVTTIRDPIATHAKLKELVVPQITPV